MSLSKGFTDKLEMELINRLGLGQKKSLGRNILYFLKKISGVVFSVLKFPTLAIHLKDLGNT